MPKIALRYRVLMSVEIVIDESEAITDAKAKQEVVKALRNADIRAKIADFDRVKFPLENRDASPTS